MASVLSSPQRGIISSSLGRVKIAALRIFALVFVAASLAGCAEQWQVAYDGPLDPAFSRSLRISDIRVSAPDTLTVSNANVFAPDADIVWFGDPMGDRRAQVAAVVENGARRAVQPLQGRQNAALNITIQEFHALTPKTRQRGPAGVHNISFYAQLVEPGTNRPLSDRFLIRSDLEAYVGARAVEAEKVGQTQKVRVTNHIAAVLQGWLGIGPDVRGVFSSVGR